MKEKYDLVSLFKEGAAFLTTGDFENANTMTIGWAMTGIMWNKPVLVIAVRESRYTYEILKNSETFSVSFPGKGKMKKELLYCGQYSGRDKNKIDECGFELMKGQKISAPVIKGCDVNFECRIIYRQELDSKLIYNEDIKEKYINDDYHTMYYGEILKQY